MSDWILYLLKVAAIQGLLFLFYRLVLSGSAHHQLNRLYLLVSLVLAFVIPFIALPMAQPAPHLDILDQWITPTDSSATQFTLIPVGKATPAFSAWQLILWIYGSITGFLLLRSLTYLTLIQQLKKQSEYVSKKWFKLFKTSHQQSFSFFSNVFIPRTIFGTDSFDQILAHECVHVRQWHSMDRLLLDFGVSLFWFNPFMYLYRKALIEIHEYQADDAVIRRFRDRVSYQEVLFSQLQSVRYSPLVSHFNFSILKKRIVMMNNPKQQSKWILVWALPLVSFVIFAFSNRQMMRPIDQVSTELVTILGPEWQVPPTLTVQQSDAYKPSILPLAPAANIKMSSGFGMRIHPVSGEEKMHLGMDFAVPVGTPVLATADGKVLELLDGGKEGYGRMVVIDHSGKYQTRYAQLDSYLVKAGDEVKKGQEIAKSGNSGQSSGPHLHYEVIEVGKGQVNPLHFIQNYTVKADTKSSGKAMIEKSAAETNEREAELAREEALRAMEASEQAKTEAELAQEQALAAQANAVKQQVEAQVAQQKAQIAQQNAQLEVELARKTTLEEELRRADEEVAAQTTAWKEGEEPIFILDGKKIDTLDDLDPKIIKSITVLKGKTAIKEYGKEGKNGVIVIVSKIKSKAK